MNSRILAAKIGYLLRQARVPFLAGAVSGVPDVRRESLAAPGAFAGTAAVRCDVAASAIVEQN